MEQIQLILKKINEIVTTFSRSIVISQTKDSRWEYISPTDCSVPLPYDCL